MSIVEEKREGFYLSKNGEWIPNGWKTVLLSDIAHIQTGPFGSQLHEKDYVKFGTPIITVENLANDRIQYTRDTPRVSAEDKIRLEKYTLKEGDIVFSRVGSVDRSSFVSSEQDGWLFSGRLLRVRTDLEHNPNFISYWLSSNRTKSFVRNVAVGATMPSINTSILGEVPVFLPPFPEQKAIAAVLGCLDDKIELLREQNETLETLAQTLFKQWFIDFNFPGEHGNPYKDSGGKMIPSELGEIPENWKTDKIDEYVSISGGGTPSTKEPAYWDGDIAWSSPKDLSDRPDAYLFKTNKMITDQGLNSISSKLNPIGSLLLSSRAPIGYVAINDIPIAVNQGYIVFAPHQYLSNQFMFLWLKKYMHLVNNAANGSTFLEISKKAFKEIETIIPDQMALSTFQDLIEPVFDKLKSNLKQVQTLTELGETLLPKLMKGEIRVPVEA